MEGVLNEIGTSLDHIHDGVVAVDKTLECMDETMEKYGSRLHNDLQELKTVMRDMRDLMATHILTSAEARQRYKRIHDDDDAYSMGEKKSKV